MTRQSKDTPRFLSPLGVIIACIAVKPGFPGMTPVPDKVP